MFAAALAVAPFAQLVDEQFGHVADDRVRAGGVAVQRRVTDGGLGLVAGGQHQPAEPVRQRHEQHATNAALEVLIGEIGSRPVVQSGGGERVGVT